MTNMPKNKRGGVWRKPHMATVCTRCQHRTCVCKPRERTFKESQLREMLQWMLYLPGEFLCLDHGGDEQDVFNDRIRRGAMRIGIDLGQQD